MVPMPSFSPAVRLVNSTLGCHFTNHRVTPSTLPW
jgi:hypothetical protein